MVRDLARADGDGAGGRPSGPCDLRGRPALARGRARLPGRAGRPLAPEPGTVHRAVPVRRKSPGGDLAAGQGPPGCGRTRICARRLPPGGGHDASRRQARRGALLGGGGHLPHEALPGGARTLREDHRGPRVSIRRRRAVRARLVGAGTEAPGGRGPGLRAAHRDRARARERSRGAGPARPHRHRPEEVRGSGVGAQRVRRDLSGPPAAAGGALPVRPRPGLRRQAGGPRGSPCLHRGVSRSRADASGPAPRRGRPGPDRAEGRSERPVQGPDGHEAAHGRGVLRRGDHRHPARAHARGGGGVEGPAERFLRSPAGPARCARPGPGRLRPRRLQGRGGARALRVREYGSRCPRPRVPAARRERGQAQALRPCPRGLPRRGTGGGRRPGDPVPGPRRQRPRPGRAGALRARRRPTTSRWPRGAPTRTSARGRAAGAPPSLRRASRRRRALRPTSPAHARGASGRSPRDERVAAGDARAVVALLFAIWLAGTPSAARAADAAAWPPPDVARVLRLVTPALEKPRVPVPALPLPSSCPPRRNCRRSR